jgi:hypothetical protein
MALCRLALFHKDAYIGRDHAKSRIFTVSLIAP